MSTSLIIFLCVVYGIGVIAAAAIAATRFPDVDSVDKMGTGVIALFWPVLLALLVVTHPVSWLGRWVAKTGGWR